VNRRLFQPVCPRLAGLLSATRCHAIRSRTQLDAHFQTGVPIVPPRATPSKRISPRQLATSADPPPAGCPSSKAVWLGTDRDGRRPRLTRRQSRSAPRPIQRGHRCPSGGVQNVPTVRANESHPPCRVRHNRHNRQSLPGTCRSVFDPKSPKTPLAISRDRCNNIQMDTLSPLDGSSFHA
jgi:hypothetical protein